MYQNGANMTTARLGPVVHPEYRGESQPCQSSEIAKQRARIEELVQLNGKLIEELQGGLSAVMLPCRTEVANDRIPCSEQSEFAASLARIGDGIDRNNCNLQDIMRRLDV